MFDYPLKKREIFTFLVTRRELREFELALQILVAEFFVYKIGDFYSLSNNYRLADRRYKGNDKARLMLKQANRSASVISCFPFVRGVAVSGSLSKNFASDGDDIDFFIITSANRLWLARTFLHLFKKFTFLLGKQDHYCMNYFIDEAAPLILEKNIYTATEISTLLPLRGTSIFDRFYGVNNWTKSFLPHNYLHVTGKLEIRNTWIRTAIEKMFANRFGDIVDNFLMGLTVKSWRGKTKRKKRNSKGAIMSLHSGKHFSKPDPKDFQAKLLQRYSDSVREIFQQYDYSKDVRNESL